ncbi:MAG: class I SAM-dependent methyltransferase [Moraxellaceae bacterium]|nr:class I SAM-dependent methyltransferase [Moraxellaceae bacterium]
MADDTDSSGISFTAFYTGEVWQRHGLSVPFLSSVQGRRLYIAGRPVEWLGKWLIGANNEILLLQRHLIIDDIVRRAIRDEGVTQIVEIACGLSPRGTRFSREFAGKGLVYIEADLPGMAARKRHLLEKAGELGSAHRVIDINILEQGTTDALETVFARDLDPARKTLVITEGLINYFDYATIHGFWTRLANCLRAFPAGIYVSDLYPNFHWHRFVRIADRLKSGLAIATRSHVTLHFDTEADIHDGFRAAGFAQTRVHLPESYYGVLEIPEQRIPSIVRVLENRVKPHQ